MDYISDFVFGVLEVGEDFGDRGGVGDVVREGFGCDVVGMEVGKVGLVFCIV